MDLTDNVVDTNSFAGPFFKCDFCGLNVTDRVSHMKVAHYSPLAQVTLTTIKNAVKTKNGFRRSERGMGCTSVCGATTQVIN